MYQPQVATHALAPIASPEVNSVTPPGTVSTIASLGRQLTTPVLSWVTASATQTFLSTATVFSLAASTDVIVPSIHICSGEWHVLFEHF